MLLATALAPFITGCAQQTFTVQNNRSSTSKETITIFSFLNCVVEENCRCSQIPSGGAENVVKTETQQTFVNGLLGFITLGIYTPLEARVYCSHCTSCPSIWATLSALLINILLGSFQLFLHSDQPLSEGEIIPFSGVCQSGRLHYPRRRRWWLHALTDRLL